MRPILLASLLLIACGADDLPGVSSLPNTDAGSDAAANELDATDDLDAATDAGAVADIGVVDPDAGTSDVDQGDLPVLDVEPAPECLELAATGSAIGDIPEDVTLLDCDGNEHSLRGLCAEQAAWVFIYTGWCPPCQENARIANDFAAEFAAEGFASYFVISQTQTFDEPDADYCAGIRDQFGLTMPVLFDPDHAMPAAVGTPYFDIDIVLGADNELLFAKQHASRDEVRVVIRSRLP